MKKVRHRAAMLRPGCALAVMAMGFAAAGLSAPAQTPSIASLRESFAHPPDDARPMMRWWWFGPAVVDTELARELDSMHQAGIGGVELAAEYPLALDDPAKGLLNLRYGSPEYVAAVRFAQTHARSLGMRVDLTLGSGWPFGGPEISLSMAAGRLKVIPVPLGSAAAAVPKMSEGDSFLAAFVAKGTATHYEAASARRIAGEVLPTALEAAEGSGPAVELFFFAGHTRQQVKRAAFGGEGYVLDHMAKPAVEQHLHGVGDALLEGFADHAPYAIFSDSLEVYGSDWTPSLPAEFKRRRGYDLISHLPELAEGGTPEAEAIRHDWGVTMSGLVRENYLRAMAEYATAHGTKFRSQTYGEPAVTLADEHIPQLPEGEGPQWRAFSFTRWASSANHVYGNGITSAETWTWLHSPAFRATPLDMKAEADHMFLEGVNQIIGHGFPYSAPGAAEPGWSLYAAAALNDHNPWWPVMPYVTAYLTRVSWALRQGVPANDIAVLLPEDDAQAAFRPGHVSITDEMQHRITPALMSGVLDAGYNLDYIDPEAMAARGLHYPVVVVPPTTRMPLKSVRLLQDYAESGGKVIFVGNTPTLAPGLDDAADSPAVAKAMMKLLNNAQHVENEAGLAGALPQALPPDLMPGDAAGKLGFLHRRLPDGDLYFLANTSAEPISWMPRIRTARRHAEWWDADSGEATPADLNQPLTLAPYGSRLLLLTDDVSPAPSLTPGRASAIAPAAVIHLTTWTASFPGSAGSAAKPTQTDVRDTLWTDSPGTRFYSGEVRYMTHFEARALGAAEHLTLHFADGTALPDTQAPNKPGMRAWYDPPVREAALVVVNGKTVGALWHPPYTLDVSSAVHPGENTLELRVFNTAINELAGQPPRDYTALKAKYGDRFQMQDMNDLQPVPSGINGPVELRYSDERGAGAEKREQSHTGGRP